MKKLTKIFFYLSIMMIPAATAEETQNAPLEIQVITTGPQSLYANMTLIKGREAMVLVDVPFTRADTHRLIADILETGKRLDTVIVTHDHPDHFFGLDLVLDTFPDARAVASPQLVQDMWRSLPLKFKRWNPMLGTMAPHHPAVPQALEDGVVMLEGHRIEVLGPMQGDHVHATAVWIPDIKALIAGDILFNHMHVWLGEHLTPQRKDWAASLDRMESLKPELIVAGHRRPDLKSDNDAIVFTRAYLKKFEQLAAGSRTSKELMEKVRKAFPDTIDVIDDFILTYSTQVAMGEIPPWDE